MTWTLCQNAAELATRACDRIEEFARQAIEEHGRFQLVLAGGSTPRACYRQLANRHCDWQHWHVYFGDERWLPEADPQRNSVMAAKELLDRVSIPSQQIHPIPTHTGSVEAAQSYSKMLECVYPFDLVLLGLGEDGHTASLFPGDFHTVAAGAVAVSNAPKPPADRVTLNAAALSSCRHLLYLISGKDKRAAVRRWLRGDPIPAATISASISSEQLVDLDAWGTQSE